MAPITCQVPRHVLCAVCDPPEHPWGAGGAVVPSCTRGATAQPGARGWGSHIHTGESRPRSTLLLPFEGVNERPEWGSGGGNICQRPEGDAGGRTPKTEAGLPAAEQPPQCSELGAVPLGPSPRFRPHTPSPPSPQPGNLPPSCGASPNPSFPFKASTIVLNAIYCTCILHFFSLWSLSPRLYKVMKAGIWGEFCLFSPGFPSA